MAAVAASAVLAARADDPVTFRELWVPHADLPAVLKAHPEAVSLHRDQYHALVRDALAQDAAGRAVTPAPAGAVLGTATASAVLGDGAVSVEAVVPVEVLNDGWVEVPIGATGGTLASVAIDGDAALRSGDGDGPAAFVLRGRGQHTASMRWVVPMLESAGGSTFVLPAIPGAGSTIRIPVPDGHRLVSQAPFSVDEGPAVFAAGGEATVQLQRGADDGDVATGALSVRASATIDYTIDAVRVQAVATMAVSSALADLPDALHFNLPPDASVLAVTGDGLDAWAVDAAGVLELAFAPGGRREVAFSVTVESPSLPPGVADAVVPLPLLKPREILAVSGRVAIGKPDGVAVREIEGGEGKEFSFSAMPESLSARVERLETRFVATADTLVSLARDAVSFRRTLSVVCREGQVFEVMLELGMAGEQVLDLRAACGRKITWRPVAGGVAVGWPGGIAAGETASIILETRWVPPGWDAVAGGASLGVEVSPLMVAGAESVTGYLAVVAADALTVATVQETGLERRDARTTPVTGSLAWFRQGDFTLGLEVGRRAAAYLATVNAYALPLFNTLEIEGEIRLEVVASQLEELEVVLPMGVAPLFRIDSPLVSSQSLDAASGTWTLRFAKGLEGESTIRFRMALPLSVGEGESRPFSASIPAISLPGARRTEGAWMVEANTDTELEFAPQGLDALDSLRVPAVAGYEPRHRVIAAFAYRGSGYALNVSGVRHPAAELATTVIESLQVDTILTEEGAPRHQLRAQVVSAGNQFLDVGLVDAKVWSLVVDGVATKPVAAGEGLVRVTLPQGGAADGSRAVTVVLTYEVPGAPWGRRGTESLAPPLFGSEVPVQRSRWVLHLPPTFSYRDFDTNLVEAERPVPGTLLGHAWGRYRRGIMGNGRLSTEERAAAAAEFARANFGDWIDEASGQKAMATLDRELDRQKKRVEDARTAMLKIQAETGIIDLDEDVLAFYNPEAGAMTAKPDVIRQAEMDAYENEKQIETYHVQLRALANKSGEELVEQVANLNLEDAIIRNWKPERDKIEAELEQELARGGDESRPEIVALREQLRQTNEKLEKAATELRASLQTKLAIAEETKRRLDERRSEGEEEDPFDNRRLRINYRDAKEEYRLQKELFQQMHGTMTKSRVDSLQPRDTGVTTLHQFRQSVESGEPLDPAVVERAIGFAREHAENGDYDQARMFVGSVLAADPTNKKALRLLENLENPEVWNAANSPAHMEAVQQVERMLNLAIGQYDLGQFEEAKESLDAVLELDAYNVAARRMREKVERHLANTYYRSDYDNTRATMSAGADELWEFATADGGGIQEKLRTIVIPRIDFQDATVDEALQFLEIKAGELDVAADSSVGRGVRMRSHGDVGGRRITLSLIDVPLGEALKYVTDLAALRFRIADGEVVVVPATDSGMEFYTRTFDVPPDFLTRFSEGEAAEADPFAAPEGGSGIMRRRTASEVLSVAGVAFPEGASAFYDAGSGKLVVRNTANNVDLIAQALGAASGAAGGGPGGAHGLAGASQADMVAGLVPLKFMLPQGGREIVLDGDYAAAPVRFGYVSWSSEIRDAWVRILVGCLLFLAVGWGRTVLVGLLGILLLTGLGMAWDAAAPSANGLLIGWGFGLLVVLAWKAVAGAFGRFSGPADREGVRDGALA
ncbi:hypothetical protein BH23VER1_BH23VER1_27970 [soil metagenome]